MNQAQVGVFQQQRPQYPAEAPFHPPATLPELPHLPLTDASNSVYDSVRTLFQMLGYGKESFGTANWNPLAWLIRPGDTVFIKPNMIAEKHLHSQDWEYVITHGSVIRPVIDYVYLALGGKGKIVVGDAPQTDSNFEKIVELNGLRSIQQFYKEALGFHIEVLDLRDEYTPMQDGILVGRVPLPGDPRGSVRVDLSEHSMFADLDSQRKTYYGAYYDTQETNAHHSDGKHEYAISRSPLEADVFINMPKLKTHKKCGITVNLKSLVGINANKNLLPHYALGSPISGGDQFPDGRSGGRMENALVLGAKRLMRRNSPVALRLARMLKRSGYALFGSTEKVVRSGNWHGNDTVWRMCLDLNRILLFGDADGRMQLGGGLKRFLSVVDGIVGMEGAGPVGGDPVPSRVVVCGSDPVIVDATCATLMGFNPTRLPIIANALLPHVFPITTLEIGEATVLSNNPRWSARLGNIAPDSVFRFQPHFGWRGQIEFHPGSAEEGVRL